MRRRARMSALGLEEMYLHRLLRQRHLASVHPDEFEPVPRICRIILAIYEDDLDHPHYLPRGGYRLRSDWVVKRVTYEQTQGQSPPYIIYTDHDSKEIVFAVRGLNLAKESDYKLLLNNRLGMQKFDGGYVHHGLFESAVWLLDQESETLNRLWVETGKEYKLIFAGHSLGSGVASLMAIIVVNHGDRLGGIPRSKVLCYALAPARMIFYQEQLPLRGYIQVNFLPGLDALDSLPCLLFLICLRDTFIPEGRKLRDPRRLYAPGRMYHIVERKFCRCGRFPPEVRTAIPVDGRFEHIVLSCNATSDHGIIWIEREAEKAVERMKESSTMTLTTAPSVQKFNRLETIEKEHKDALERAVTLNIPHALTSQEGQPSLDSDKTSIQIVDEGSSEAKSQLSSGKANWNEVVQKLFRKESGKLQLKRDTETTV